ncbi:MAG TPA: glycosyltransferase family 39 protein [Xanthobacteraceae bacterium]|jgi:4-amino-4-deoxy-L-arabinose transferase-like glycosyltransferase|nr:glycosyltransferase family 39 protein [Xanthobacteraceae bacterium]
MTTIVADGLRPGMRDFGARVLDAATASHARVAVFLLAMSLVCFLPGFFNIAPIDRDEARFAQATKQMIESGEYIDIRFQDEVRYKKPVGIYWLQAAAVRAGEALGVPQARTTIWLYRIPSLAGALAAVVLTYWTALAFVSRRGACLAALMLAASLMLGVEARLAKTDAVLLATVAAAMGAMAREYMRRDTAAAAGLLLPAVFWTALAAGVLIKGPLIVMVVALAAVVLAVVDRSAAWLARLRPLVGVAWLLLLVLPWFIAIVGRAGDAFFVGSVGGDLMSKLSGGSEGHWAPPLTYLVLFWLTFWPAAPLAALAGPAVWRHRREPAVRFLLAWLVPAWIVFELVPTKLPHYVLPLYPAIAILIAWAIEREALSAKRWIARITVHWPVIAAVLPILAIVAVIVLRRQLGLLAWPFAAGAMIFGFFAWRLFDQDGPARSFLRAAVAAQLGGIAVFGAIVPLLHPFFPAAALAQVVTPRCEHPRYAAAGYHEPSIVFLFGTATLLTDGQGAADFLGEGSCRFALIEARQERSFVRRAEAIGLRYAPGPRVDGFNYNEGGRAITIAVYRSEAQP